jgi:hypothetical protein
MNSDQYTVKWLSMWEKPQVFEGVDEAKMQKLWKEGKDLQYKVEVSILPLEQA